MGQSRTDPFRKKVDFCRLPPVPFASRGAQQALYARNVRIEKDDCAKSVGPAASISPPRWRRESDSSLLDGRQTPRDRYALAERFDKTVQRHRFALP